ncbi:FAD-dependent pyridine nucleotide-disulfide oxidoreductase [Nitratireductor indicus C115]|uniref:Thioredoxin reductase n=1 Tax=Nitratireductor indicus C115 TaxID=1231190 RepID=K2P2Q4_9HYPH|nr:NAD(P)/FAD-dependent oxidoreductase [Nitratireductor indicus]EKF41611.1 FAD-dependent pyridine nucleotide-disulfide oxidoreductase [Nitratireductor indicus C115]SFQ70442.1 Thioredoxin reductase [Nitratireductor indicus]
MHHDAIIIGGSFAGLATATYIGRARRSACVIDTGKPRNRFAKHSHGFLTQDGSEPGAMLSAARDQVSAYPTVSFVSDAAVSVERDGDGFVVQLQSGDMVSGSKLVLAYGISDELPKIPGLAEHWGQSVIHCPYCHGFEFSGQRLGVLSVSPMSTHQAILISEWGPTTYFLNGSPMPDDETLAKLKERGVAIEPAAVAAVHGDGQALAEIEFDDGRALPLDALYLGPRNRFNSDIGDKLGCAVEETPFGRFIRTDGEKKTSVSDVYAAGDITRGAHSVTFACADGVMAATSIHRSLVF